MFSAIKFGAMSSASFFVVILASCLTAMGRHTSCPVRGQVYTSCGSACPPTCTDLNNLICTTQCVAGCQCPAGTVLDVTSNSCVTRDECPESACSIPGQVYNPCGSACPPTCTDLNNLICTTQCVAGCQCPAGTVLDVTSNSCVTRDECPESACSIPGQVYNPCGSACPPNCTDLNPTCTKQCVAGCQCPAGTVLDVTSNSCVTIDECPDSACPVQGQGFTLCGSACPPNCTIPNPFCITLCVARCECPDGKVIDETSNSCVTLDKCPDSSKPSCL